MNYNIIKTFILDKAIQFEGIKLDESEQKILAFPRGKYFVEGINETLTFDDKFFNDIISNFKNQTLSKPFVDKRHEFGESFGDINGFEITPAGLMAIVKLNKKGIELIKDNVFKYISPAFSKMKDSVGNVLNNVLNTLSLTNVPALNGAMPTIQSQVALSVNEIKDIKILKENNNGGNMENLVLLTKFLGLVPESNENVILEKVTNITFERDNLKTKIIELEKGKDLSDKEVIRLSSELNKIELAKKQENAEKTIMLGITEGKIQPAQKEVMIQLYLEKPELVKTLLDKVPAKQTSQKSVNDNSNNSNMEITDEDRFVMLERGMDINKPEDVKFYKTYVLGK